MIFIAIASSCFSGKLKVARQSATLSQLRPAFSNALIASQQLLFLVHKTWCKRAAYFERARHRFHFLLAELTCALAAENSVILIHALLLSLCLVQAAAAGRGPYMVLTANLAYVLVSIRAGIIGAE
jgi:hypothetical protein